MGATLDFGELYSWETRVRETQPHLFTDVEASIDSDIERAYSAGLRHVITLPVVSDKGVRLSASCALVPGALRWDAQAYGAELARLFP